MYIFIYLGSFEPTILIRNKDMMHFQKLKMSQLFKLLAFYINFKILQNGNTSIRLEYQTFFQNILRPFINRFTLYSCQAKLCSKYILVEINNCSPLLLEVICNHAKETIFYRIFLNALKSEVKPDKGQKILKANYDVLNYSRE